MDQGIPRALGVFNFAKAKTTITLSNPDANGFVSLDGLQLVPEELAKTERATRADAGFPVKTSAAPVPVKIPPPMRLQSAAQPQAIDGKSYDLIVIGGTPGGIACAVRAAREGLSVLLVNHTQHLGGFITSGAGGWEAPYDGLRSPIYGEMITGAGEYYSKTYGVGSSQHLLSQPSQTSRAHIDRPKIEPRIAEMLFNQMVEKKRR
jgi:NADPH-dependent 2,4-dienoyl-CoA reductase/sulfur reductase-like enzyme